MKKHSPRFETLCEAARRNVTEVTAEAVRARLAAKERFLLLDIREDHEWAVSRLPSAKHLGRGIVERDIEKLVPDLGTEMVLYCGGGYRAALSAESLQKMGYTNVKSIAGGFRGWTSKNFELDDKPETTP